MYILSYFYVDILLFFFFFFFFNDTATTEIYTLSLHDALPICVRAEIDDVGGMPGLLASGREDARVFEFTADSPVADAIFQHKLLNNQRFLKRGCQNGHALCRSWSGVSLPLTREHPDH